jgi:siroheme synthase-like protein
MIQLDELPASTTDTPATAAGNTLFPVFLKLEQFKVLIVGGGAVGLEKIKAILGNSPETAVTLVGSQILPEIRDFAADFKQVTLREKPFERADLDGQKFVIAATDDPNLNRQVKALAAGRGILTNVADTPALCDFYLGSIVQKGDLKIAISTNGKSPTIAKRLKEVLQEALPDELHDLLQNMNKIRNRLSGDFTQKVKALNRVTRRLSSKPDSIETLEARNWRRLATISLVAFGLLLIVNLFFVTGLHQQLEPQFYTFLAIGFAAQMIDGLLGMGYGVTAAIGLMTINVPAAAMSSSIHTAEMFAAGASGYSHYRFGNVKRELFRALLLPGVLGAIGGALLLIWLDGQGAQYVKPVLAVYTLILGTRILHRAFFPKTVESEVKRVGWLAGAGGFLDSFGGGGWGPLVTGTLITKGKTPRYVIGSVSLTEFFVTMASAVTFFSVIGIKHWQVILGLIAGGVLAAPLAARLTGKLPVRQMTIGVGVMVILWSVMIFVKVFWG